jgi:hypothetical protein
MQHRFIYFILTILIITGCSRKHPESIGTDICIYGGTASGVIAAYSAHLMGKSTVIIEPGVRLGGLTTGGLGHTDIGNKYAISGLAKDFYRRVGSEYGTLEKWSFEPSVALKVLHDYMSQTDVNVIYDHRVVNVQKNGQTIELISLERSTDPDSAKVYIKARQFIDCSYEGDLMARSGVSYTIGREGNDVYNESYNGVQLSYYHQFKDGIDPYKLPGDPSSGLLWGIGDHKLKPKGTGDNAVQAYNIRLCLIDDPNNMIPITRPEGYDSTIYELLIRQIYNEGPPYSIYNHFLWLGIPNRKTDINNYGGFSTDMIGMNWDYPDSDYKGRERIFQAHKLYTQGLLYFYATDTRIPEVMNQQMKTWGYPKDEFLKNNHFTPQLYIREARRMIGEYVMTEANCLGKLSVEDGIGMAAYQMDSHNTHRLVVDGNVKNEGDVEEGGFPPYPISYRSITPKREECNNLLVPVSLSASHIAFGSIRMEPVFMVLGQTAAVAASMAIDANSIIQEIDIKELQNKLITDPFLDGTSPEIVIDNHQIDLIEHSDGFQIEKTTWRDKAYMTDFLVDMGQSEDRYIQFTMEVDETRQYELYYYCPAIDHLINGKEIAENLSYTVETESTILNQSNIGFANIPRSWAYCGTYDFSNSELYTLTIRAGKYDGAFAADAVLLLPK